MWMRFCFAVVTLLALAGCATRPVAMSPDEAARLQRVGVVSMIGERLNQEYVGILVFGNAYNHFDIAAWHLDDYAESLAVSAIEAKGRIKAVPLGTYRSRFGPAYGRNQPAGLFVDPNADFERIKAPLAEVAARENIDAFVFITDANIDNFAQTNQGVVGLNIWARPGTTRLFFVHRVHVVNARTLKVMTGGHLLPERFTPRFRPMDTLILPSETLFCLHGKKAPSTKDIETLQPIVKSVLAETIPATVTRLLDPALNEAWQKTWEEDPNNCGAKLYCAARRIPPPPCVGRWDNIVEHDPEEHPELTKR